MDIRENAKRIIERVWTAAQKAGRRPEDILIVAASKMNSAENIREATLGGITAFGENRVQELLEKKPLGAYEGAELHFIGHLQRNKVKMITGQADLIQSVDSQELIERIGKRACELGIVQRILIEVNIGGEAAKSGIVPEETEKYLELVSKTQGIVCEGLMTVPPKTAEKAELMGVFRGMEKLFIDISAKKYDNVTMKFLSMGMSADFEEAIMAGGNVVRIGTAIFGPRDYSK